MRGRLFGHCFSGESFHLCCTLPYLSWCWSPGQYKPTITCSRSSNFCVKHEGLSIYLYIYLYMTQPSFDGFEQWLLILVHPIIPKLSTQIHRGLTIVAEWQLVDWRLHPFRFYQYLSIKTQTFHKSPITHGFFQTNSSQLNRNSAKPLGFSCQFCFSSNH